MFYGLHLKKDTFLGKNPDEVVEECLVLIIPETEMILRLACHKWKAFQLTIYR